MPGIAYRRKFWSYLVLCFVGCCLSPWDERCGPIATTAGLLTGATNGTDECFGEAFCFMSGGDTVKKRFACMYAWRYSYSPVYVIVSLWLQTRLSTWKS